MATGCDLTEGSRDGGGVGYPSVSGGGGVGYPSVCRTGALDTGFCVCF